MNTLRVLAHLDVVEAFLEVGVPVVLDLIVSALWQAAGYGRPPVSESCMEVEYQLLLLLGEMATLDVWPQVVRPPQPTALATPQQTCSTESCNHHINISHNREFAEC